MPLVRKAVPGPRNPCTHMTMTRLFDTYGSFKCSICQKHAPLGLLYRCTQDTDGLLPESDFTGNLGLTRNSLGQDVTTHSLSSSVIKAIGHGQYTDDQIKKLMQLKEGVRDLVMAQDPLRDNRPPTSSTFTTSSSSSSDNCTLSTIPQSATFSTYSSTSLDEEIKQAYDWEELQKVWMSDPAVTPPKPRLYSSIPAPPPTMALPQPRATISHAQTHPCSFRACPTCRPTYRDRAFQSLDEVLSKPNQLPPIWELENRRISDARVVARIGLRRSQPTRFYAQTDPAALHSRYTIPGIVIDHPEGETEYDNPSQDQYGRYKEDGQAGPEQNIFSNNGAYTTHMSNVKDVQASHKTGRFRQSLRKALTRSCDEDMSLTGSQLSNTDNSAESHTRPKPRSRNSSSLHFLRRRSRSSTLSFMETPGTRVVDTSPLQESVVLMVATNTPLPPTPGMQGFNVGPGRDTMPARATIHNEASSFSPVDVISQA